MLLGTFLSILEFTASAKASPASIVEGVQKRSKLDFSTYAPVRIACPATDQWVRPANGLSQDEATWVAARKKKALGGLSAYLRRLNFCDIDIGEYLERLERDTSNVPTVGMALSGGGWASAFTGTGAMLALDERSEAACQQRTGGLLQSMTYLSGLSGGAWPVMSLATYNFPTIGEMVANWHVDQSATFATENTKFRATPDKLFEQIVPKFEAGFHVGLMEMLGRGLAYEFVAGEKGGMTTMVSDIVSLSNFQDHEMPFPMWQASQGTSDDIKYFGLLAPYYNATIFEWNPLEFGAWNGPEAFFPTKYLGTKMSDGQPSSKECIVGFDRASYMLASAADATNFWDIEALSNGTAGSFGKRQLQPGTVAFPLSVMLALEQPFQEYFNYTLSEMMYTQLPNPFAASGSTTDDNAPPANLTLLDESEAGQSLPLWSQIQPARDPQFIIAWDNGQDAHPYNWNNGSSLHVSAEYANNNSIPFPLVPSPATFINRKLTSKPVFFGCDAELTNTKDTRSPIILYMANAPYSAYSNFTWTQSVFSEEQMAVILTNSFNEVTFGNGTLDPEWPECLGCAVIDRSLARVGMERTPQCQACMARYCWDGVVDDREPGLVDLPLALDPKWTFAQWNDSVTADFWPETEAKDAVGVIGKGWDHCHWGPHTE